MLLAILYQNNIPRESFISGKNKNKFLYCPTSFKLVFFMDFISKLELQLETPNCFKILIILLLLVCHFIL